MTRAALVAIACMALSTSGCSTRRGAGIGVGVGVGTMLVGAVVIGSAPQGDAGFGTGIMGLTIVGFGGAIAGLSLINLAVLAIAGKDRAEAPREDDATDGAVVEEPAAADPARERARQIRRQAAWERTESAQQAARAQDCGTVRSLDEEVRTLDPVFHEKVFIADVSIAACLAAPAPPGPPAPEAPAAPATP